MDKLVKTVSTKERVIWPKIVNVELTTECPLRCPQCYKSDKLYEERILPFNHFLEIIDSAREFGCKRVLLSGGEPMVYAQINEAISEVRNRDMEVYLSTGGYGVDKEAVQRISERGLNGLYVSLNGSTEKVNSLSRDGFSSALDVLIKAHSLDLETRINWVARRDNYKDFKKLITLAEELGVSQIDILRDKSFFIDSKERILLKSELLEIKDTIENYNGMVFIAIESCFFELRSICNQTSRSPLLRGCSAGKYSLSINALGQASPCAHSDESYEDYLNYGSLADYWRQSPIVNQFRCIDHTYEICSSCNYCNLCRPCKLERDVGYCSVSG